MILRMWTGLVKAEEAEAYHRYVAKTGLVSLRGTPGNRGALLCRPGRRRLSAATT